MYMYSVHSYLVMYTYICMHHVHNDNVCTYLYNHVHVHTYIVMYMYMYTSYT